MKTTITIELKTRLRINQVKYKLGLSSADETINKILNIVEKIQVAK